MSAYLSIRCAGPPGRANRNITQDEDTMSIEKNTDRAGRLLAPLCTTFLLVALAPAVCLADTAEEIRAEVVKSAAYVRENRKGQENTIAEAGAVEFWSSGGLMQRIPADAPVPTYEQFSLTPKHIEVITLVEGEAAVAMYYSEGAYHPTGAAAVSHYMTRVTEVYVKEDGRWKVRAAHYSPIAAGMGTSQTAID
jgi:hypothetical protein